MEVLLQWESRSDSSITRVKIKNLDMQIIKNEEGSQVTSWMRHQDPLVRWKCPRLPNEKMGRMVSEEGLQGDQRKVAPGPTHLVDTKIG